MSNALRTTVLTAALMLAAPAANAELYAYSDAAGATTYTDRPTVMARSSSSSTNRAKGMSIGAQYHARDVELDADSLSGTWCTVSQDGMHTRFEIRPNGTFLFDQRATQTPERTWMCGTVDFSGGAMTLALSESKHRTAEGAIEQQLGESQAEATVVSAGTGQLVLRIEGETLVFQRVASAGS